MQSCCFIRSFRRQHWVVTDGGWLSSPLIFLEKKHRSWWWLWKSVLLIFPLKKKKTSIEDVPAHGGRAFSHRSLHPCHVHQAEAAPNTQDDEPWTNISGWWYTYPSEKYESQLGWLFPKWTLYCQTSPYGHYIDFVLWMVAKSCITLDGWNPINNGINHLSTGAGFLPSTIYIDLG